MDNLMKLLGADKDKSSAPMDAGADLNPPEDDAKAEGSPEDNSEGFNAAASEAMDALSSHDVAAFSEALKTCIDMAQ